MLTKSLSQFLESPVSDFCAGRCILNDLVCFVVTRYLFHELSEKLIIIHGNRDVENIFVIVHLLADW